MLFISVGNITPTPSRSGDQDGEEFEMTRLLPTTANANKPKLNNSEDDLECVRRKTRQNMEETNGNEKMILSRTSDLTASITSNDLTLRAFDSPTIYYRQPTSSAAHEKEGSIGYEGTDDYDELDADSGGGGSNGGFSETDTLLSSKKASHILNLTHIEDNDICFADD